MRPATSIVLAVLAVAGAALPAAGDARAAPPTRDVRADRRATAESISAQYAAEQFRMARVADEKAQALMAENEAQRRRLAAVLKDAKATAAQRDEARAQIRKLDQELSAINARLMASEQASDELKAQVREYERQITEAVETASPEVAAAYEQYAQGDRDAAYAVIDRLSRAEAEAAKRAGEIRAGALLRRPATLAFDRRDRGEMTLAQVIEAWERAQAADPRFHRGWLDLTELYIEAGRLADARRAADETLKTAATDLERGMALGLLGEVQLDQGDAVAARASLKEAVAVLEALTKSAPEDAVALRALMAVRDRLGDSVMADRDDNGALALFRTNLDTARKLLALAPDNKKARRDLMLALTKVGVHESQMVLMQSADARFTEALAVLDELQKLDPANPEYKRYRAAILIEGAGVAVARGDGARAAARFEEGEKILRGLGKADPSSATLQSDLAVALQRRAMLLDTRKDLPRYRVLMDEVLTIRRRVAAADPTNMERQREISYALDLYAIGLAQAGAFDEARKKAEERVQILRAIAAGPKADGMDQRRVGVAIEDLARILEAGGDRAGALAGYEESLAFRRKLFAINPQNSIAQHELGVALLAVADFHYRNREWQRSRPLFEEAIDNLRKAGLTDGANVQIFRDLAAAYARLGDVGYMTDDFPTASSAYRQSSEIYIQIVEARPDNAQFRREFWQLLYRVAELSTDQTRWFAAVSAMEEADKRGQLDSADRKQLAFAREQASLARAGGAPASGGRSVVPSNRPGGLNR